MNSNDGKLTPSSQQKLTQYSSDVVKKGLDLALSLSTQLKSEDVNSIKFWKCIKSFGEDLGSICSVSISADGRFLASYDDESIKIWDLSSYQLIKEFSGHYPVRISSDGGYIASIREDLDGVNIWNITTGQLENSVIINSEKFSPNIQSVAISPDLKWLANTYEIIDETTGEWDISIAIWDMKTGQYLHSLICKIQDYSLDVELAYSPNSQIIVAYSSSEGIVEIWNPISKTLQKTISLTAYNLIDFCSIAVSNNGLLAIDNVIFDIHTEKPVYYINYSSSDDEWDNCWSPNSHCFSTDGTTLISGGLVSDPSIKILKLFSVDTYSSKNHENFNSELARNLVDLGDIYYEADYFEEAIKYYTQALSLDFSNIDIFSHRGQAYYQLENYQEAIDDYTKAIHIDPDSEFLYVCRGKANIQIANYHEAIQDFNQALAINDQNAHTYFCRGVIYSELGNYQKAIEDYTQAIQINPNDDSLYLNLGNAYADLEYYIEAIANFTEAIKINPSNDRAFYNRGFIHGKLENNQESIDDYTQVIRIKPNFDQAYINRGSTYYALHKYLNCINDLTEGLKLNPNHSNADKILWIRGCAYYDSGNKEQALDDLQQALNINYSCAEALSSRAFIRKNLGDYKGALEDYTRLLNLDPNNFNAYNQRSTVYLAIGDFQKAIEDLQKAQQLS